MPDITPTQSPEKTADVLTAEIPDEGKRAEVIKESIDRLPAAQQKDVQRYLFGIQPTKVNGLYWLILITLCLVVVLCTARVIGIWSPSAEDVENKVIGSADQVLGIITTVVAFLIGLFSPSPVGGK